MGKGSLEYLKRQINSGEFKKENLQKIINTNTVKREALRDKNRREKSQYYKQQKQEKLLADIESVKEQNPSPRDTKLLDELKNTFIGKKALTQNELDKKEKKQKLPNKKKILTWLEIWN